MAGEKKKNYIYLIQELDQFQRPTEYYKVGRTNNKKNRMQELQTGNPRHLIMIHCTKNQVDLGKEKAVHQHLKRVPEIRFCHETEGGGTEWYYSQNVEFMKSCFDEGVGNVLTEDVNIHDLDS